MGSLVKMSYKTMDYRQQTLEHIINAKKHYHSFVKCKLDGKDTHFDGYWTQFYVVEAMDLVRLNRGTGHCYVCLLNVWTRLRALSI